MPKNNKKFYGWHFRHPGGLQYRDNRNPALGRKLEFRSDYDGWYRTPPDLPTICQVGMHASKCVAEAVVYVLSSKPEARLTRVIVEDDIHYDTCLFPDKISGRHRTILAQLSPTDTWELCNILQERAVEILLTIYQGDCSGSYMPSLTDTGTSGLVLALTYFSNRKPALYQVLDEIALDYMRQHGKIAAGRGLTEEEEHTPLPQSIEILRNKEK